MMTREKKIYRITMKTLATVGVLVLILVSLIGYGTLLFWLAHLTSFGTTEILIITSATIVFIAGITIGFLLLFKVLT